MLLFLTLVLYLFQLLLLVYYIFCVFIHTFVCLYNISLAHFFLLPLFSQVFYLLKSLFGCQLPMVSVVCAESFGIDLICLLMVLFEFSPPLRDVLFNNNSLIIFLTRLLTVLLQTDRVVIGSLLSTLQPSISVLLVARPGCFPLVLFWHYWVGSDIGSLVLNINLYHLGLGPLLVDVLHRHWFWLLIEKLESCFVLLWERLGITLLFDNLVVLESLCSLLEFVVHYLIVVLHDSLNCNCGGYDISEPRHPHVSIL